MKSLDQIEPRIPITNVPVTISQPGSYYLTGNLTCTTCTNSSQNGITVASGNVTIDLNGFSLLGSLGSGDGISSTGASNCVVRNGTVTGWGAVGIDLTFGGQVLNCVVSGNQAAGIGVYAGLVRDCTAVYNGGTGIVANQSTVGGCTASYNTGYGIYGPGHSTINSCSAAYNHGPGIYASDYCTISGCTANQNQSTDGIRVDYFCNVSNNTADANIGTPGSLGGIHATANGNRIDSNHTFNNTGDGILVNTNATGNIVIRNTSGNNVGFQFRVPGAPGQPPAGANIIGPIVTDATNASANAWANFQ